MSDLITQTDKDDLGFVALAGWLLNGAMAKYRPAEVYVICIDGWFDAKWLDFSGKALGAVAVWRKDTTIPPFHPNRVLGEKHFAAAPDAAGYVAAPGRLLHVAQPSERNFTRAIAKVAPSAVFFWYSTSTRGLDRGSTMLYRTDGGEVFSWYASFHRSPAWRLDRHSGISSAELGHLLKYA